MGNEKVLPLRQPQGPETEGARLDEPAVMLVFLSLADQNYLWALD